MNPYILLIGAALNIALTLLNLWSGESENARATFVIAMVLMWMASASQWRKASDSNGRSKG